VIGLDKNIHKLINYSDGGVLSKVIFNDDKINITLFCMAKNTTMSEHTASRNGVIYVIEGKGTFTLEGEDIDMIPGSMILMNKDMRHALKADQNTSFILYLY
jgi:quercetin dioxygenase-like cupin family protein